MIGNPSISSDFEQWEVMKIMMIWEFSIFREPMFAQSLIYHNGCSEY